MSSLAVVLSNFPVVADEDNERETDLLASEEHEEDGFCPDCQTDLRAGLPLNDDNKIVCSCGNEYSEEELGLE